MTELNPHKNFKIPGKLIQQLKVGDIRIWDVRSPMEFIHGHIDGAENVPFDELDWYLSQGFCSDKTIITCSTGDQRSARVCDKLKDLGVDVVDGGDWEQLKEMISYEKI